MLTSANRPVVLPNNPTLRAEALRRPQVLGTLPHLDVKNFQLPWKKYSKFYWHRDYDPDYEDLPEFARFGEQDMRWFLPPSLHFRPRAIAEEMPLRRAHLFFRSLQPSIPPPLAPPIPPQPTTLPSPPQPSTLPAAAQPSTSPTTAVSNSQQPNTAPPQPSTLPAAAQPSTSPTTAPSNSQQPNTAPTQPLTRRVPPHLRALQLSTSPAAAQPHTAPVQEPTRRIPPHLRPLQPSTSPAPPQSNTSPAPPEATTPPYIPPHLRVPQPTTPQYTPPHLRVTQVTATNQATAMSQPAPAPSTPLQPNTQPPPAPPAPAQTISSNQHPMYDAQNHFGEGIYPPINPTLVCPCNLEGHHCRALFRDNFTHDWKTICNLVEVCTSKVWTY